MSGEKVMNEDRVFRSTQSKKKKIKQKLNIISPFIVNAGIDRSRFFGKLLLKIR